MLSFVEFRLVGEEKSKLSKPIRGRAAIFLFFSIGPQEQPYVNL